MRVSEELERLLSHTDPEPGPESWILVLDLVLDLDLDIVLDLDLDMVLDLDIVLDQDLVLYLYL